ncbi:MAG: ABC transporter ATP-binding protein, partial [Actinobacteria bacterium]|nr:ABC transporter ATP-binding protein [Actinomycetota bacterium]
MVKARALTDFSIDIEEGEVFGLLGPNGSGKSTAIKLILGLIFPSAGEVSVFGRPAGNLSVKPRVGYLPEESYLYRFLSAEETLDFYGRLFGLGRRERRARTGELLEMVGLARERHRPVAEYSKGMQRRVALAQCLINRPDLIVLDEPTSGMDPVGTAEIKQLILRERDEGRTVLLCSHLLANVEDVCDRVSILCEGEQKVTGPLESFIADDQLTRVTAAMDAATIEAVKAVIREREGEDVPIDVSPPVERLEKFFLRVVQEAR